MLTHSRTIFDALLKSYISISRSGFNLLYMFYYVEKITHTKKIKSYTPISYDVNGIIICFPYH